MAKRNLLSKLKVRTEDINVQGWIEPNINALSKDDITKYQNRKRAILDYLTKPDKTLKDISKETGIIEPEIYRYLKRCLSFQQNGDVYGFNALLPYIHIYDYTRTDTSDSGNAGKLKQLFTELPDVEQYVTNLFLGRREKDNRVREPEMAFIDIHECFKNKLTQLGKTDNDYPLNTKTKARSSLRDYLHQLQDKNLRGFANARYGADTARKLDATIINEEYEKNRLIWDNVKPYSDVQLDEHLLNVLMIIHIQAPDGSWIPQLFDRLWLIVLIDVVTKVIISYHLCLTRYNSDDLLEIVAKSMEPTWKPKELTIPKLTYKTNAGFPASNIPQCEWLLFDKLSMDNDACHMAKSVQETIIGTTGCTINLGKKAHPETRGIVERVFRTLDSCGFNRITSTTGMNILDSRRRHPERDAIKYEIHVNELEELLDVIIANYNATPHSSCFGMTPLDLLNGKLSEGFNVLRKLPKEQRDKNPLFNYSIDCTVRGSISSGTRPYVQYMNAKYTNELLSTSPSMIRRKLTLIPNRKDLRVIPAYFDDGMFYGYLRAASPWNKEKHSLRIRKAIIKNINEGKLSRNTTNPIRAYHKLLEKRARSNRKDRNRLVDFQRKTEIDLTNTISEFPVETVTQVKSKKPRLLHRHGWIKIT